jgi:hypothetical protein
MLSECIEKINKQSKKRKEIEELKLKFSLPDELIVEIIIKLPERKIEKKHQGHGVFITCSKI